MLKSNGRISGITIGAPTCQIDGEDSSATNAWICDGSGEIIVDYTTKPISELLDSIDISEIKIF